MLTFAGIGVVALFIGLHATWRNNLPKSRVWLMLIAGLVGVGIIGTASYYAAGWIVQTLGRIVGPFVGGLIGLAIGVVAIAELWHAMHPKKGKPKKWHGFLALFAPALLGACGGIFASLTHGGTDLVSHLSSMVGR